MQYLALWLSWLLETRSSIFTIHGQTTSRGNGSDSDDHEADDHDCYDQDGDDHKGDNHEADDQHGGDHDVNDRHDQDGDAADDDIHLQFSLLRPRVGSLEPATRILRLLQNKTASMLMVAMMMTRVVMSKRKIMLATMMTTMMTMTA